MEVIHRLCKTWKVWWLSLWFASFLDTVATQVAKFLIDFTENYFSQYSSIRIKPHYCPIQIFLFISDKYECSAKKILPHIKKKKLPKVCVHSSKFFSGNLCFRAPFVHIQGVLLKSDFVSTPCNHQIYFSLHYSIGPHSHASLFLQISLLYRKKSL